MRTSRFLAFATGLGLFAMVLLAGFTGASTDVGPVSRASNLALFEASGPKVYIPALHNIGGQTADVGGWIQVQNAGDESAVAVLTYWGTAGDCVTPDYGSTSSDVLPPGASWRWTTADLPAWVRSAQVQAYTGIPISGGQPIDVPLAVAVGRSAPSPAGGGAQPLFTGYTPVPSREVAIPNPDGQYEYTAQGIYANVGGHNSWLNIQNAGDSCASVTLEFITQGEACSPTTTCTLSGLAPGAARAYDVRACVADGFQGSVSITSSQPVAAVADRIITDRLASSRVAVPVAARHNAFQLFGAFNVGPPADGETTFFAQNLGLNQTAKVKLYLLNRHGDIEKTAVQRPAPRCTSVFHLGEMSNVPDEPLQQARIESQEWWDPGNPVYPPPITAAAETTHTGQDQILSQTGYNLGEAQIDIGTIALPQLFHQFSDPTLPVTDPLTSKVVVVTMWRRGAGDINAQGSEVALDLLDPGGDVHETITRTVVDKQTVAFDLADSAALPTNWRGAGVVRFARIAPGAAMQFSAIVADYTASTPVAIYEGVRLALPRDRSFYLPLVLAND
jgi:hypothetical protein